MRTYASLAVFVAVAITSTFAKEDEAERVPLRLLPRCAEKMDPEEAGRLLGLSKPVMVDEFVIGTTNAFLFSRLHDASNNTLCVVLTLANYDANRISYDFSIRPPNKKGATSGQYSCGVEDSRFNAFSVLCLNWINCTFQTNEHQRLLEGELSDRARTASEAYSVFYQSYAQKNVGLDGLTTKQAAAVFGLSCPVEVTAFGCCACDKILFFGLEDAQGKLVQRVVGHSHESSSLSTESEKSPESGLLSPKQNEALCVLCLDWIGRTFSKTEDGVSYVWRTKAEVTANRIFAYFDRNRHDLFRGLTYVNADGRPFTGKICKRYPSGRIESVVPVLNGRENGISRSWYESGQMAEECVLVEGWCESEVTEWYSNGIKKSIKAMRGATVGNRKGWYPNANRKHEIYVDPETFGLDRVVKYFTNGVKQIECVWTNNIDGGCYWYILGQWNELGRVQAITNHVINHDDLELND